MSIDRKTIYRSALLAVTMQWSVRAIGLISVVVLARLLQPSDFGVVAVALSAAAFVELFGWIGLRQALLRVAEPEREHYDTAWTIQLILFMALALAMVAIAPLAAAFYGNPAISGILMAMSLRMVALAVSNIGIVDFERDMTFGRDMTMRLAVRVAALVVSLVAAVVLRNYWALVIGMVANSVFWMIGTYVAHPYRPRFGLARRAEILGVSMWMFVSTFSEWVQSQIERLVLGRFAPTATIGLYSVSKDLSSIFTQEIATALNRVTFVTVARGDADSGSKSDVATVIGAYATIVAPLAAGLVATAPDTIAVLLGEKWLPAAPLMRIIAIYTGLQALFLMVGSVLQASGQAPRAAKLNIAGALLSALLIGGAAWFTRRPDAVAIAAVAANALMLSAGIAMLAARAEASAVGLASNLIRPFLAAAAMAFVLADLATIATGSPFLDLLIEVPLGALVYAGTLFLLWFALGRPAGAEREAALLAGSLRRRFA
ncbi:oligosaccharide flippase family protein [Sphingomonas parva]|nr:oligosaccharide flippase family protein [Sphingomonas parva]